jgi:hypothetical protein
MRWWIPAVTGLAPAALVASFAAGAGPLPPAEPLPSARLAPRIELLAPVSGENIRRLVPLALLEGRIRGPDLRDSDVVLAIDQSNSALLASGLDVDGDGTLGRSRSWARDGGGIGASHQRWTSDRGDIVLAAELAAARALVEGLAARGNRIGVLTYTDAVRVRRKVGEPADARAALGGIRPIVDWTGTNHSRALAIADDLLAPDGSEAAGRRPRVVVLFSDGRPTVPNGQYWATRQALSMAAELGERGVVVYTVSFGEESDPEYLGLLARTSGGALLSLEDLRALANEPSRARLEARAIEVENLTTRAPARAVRALADGSFDAVVPLAEGENVLEVRALFDDAERASARTSVRYERPEPATDADQREAASWLELLRERTREIGG